MYIIVYIYAMANIVSGPIKTKHMKTVTSTSLRNSLKKYLDMVSESYQTLLVPRNNNEEAVVIMPLSEYNSLIETNYLQATEANRKRIKESLEQVEKGDVVTVNGI